MRSNGKPTVKPLLAVDPGTDQSSWVVWDGARVLTFGTDANEDLLISLEGQEGMTSPFDDIQYMAVEMIASYGMPVGREVFETCVWIGKFLHAWKPRSYRQIFRREVKLELCGSPRAKDANVRRAILDRVGPQGTKKNPGPTYGFKKDEWAALGVALVAWGDLHQSPNRAIARGS